VIDWREKYRYEEKEKREWDKTDKYETV